MLKNKKFLYGTLILLTLFFIACNDKGDVTLDKNSVNIGSVGKEWPKKFKLTTAEERVLKQYGRPDAFRIWWTKQGAFQNTMQVKRILSSKQIKDIKKSWIYEGLEKEIVFTSQNTYKEVPITEQLKLVLEYGDPESIDKFTDKNGILRERWSYFSLGKDYVFFNGHLSETNEYPAMGGVFEK